MRRIKYDATKWVDISNGNYPSVIILVKDDKEVICIQNNWRLFRI